MCRDAKGQLCGEKKNCHVDRWLTRDGYGLRLELRLIGHDMVVTRGFTESTRVVSKFSLQWLVNEKRAVFKPMAACFIYIYIYRG